MSYSIRSDHHKYATNESYTYPLTSHREMLKLFVSPSQIFFLLFYPEFHKKFDLYLFSLGRFSFNKYLNAPLHWSAIVKNWQQCTLEVQLVTAYAVADTTRVRKASSCLLKSRGHFWKNDINLLPVTIVQQRNHSCRWPTLLRQKHRQQQLKFHFRSFLNMCLTVDHLEFSLRFIQHAG